MDHQHMRPAILIVLLLLGQLAGLAQKGRTATANGPGCHVDTARYVIFSSTSGSRPIIRRKVVLFDATPEQVDRAECVLRAFHERCVKDNPAILDSLYRSGKGMVSVHFGQIDLDTVLRQYVGGKDEQGHDLIYLLGLRNDPPPDWKTQWVTTTAKNSYSFRAVVDLTLGKIEVLEMNEVH